MVVIVNQPVIFTDISTNTPTSYDWDFGDGTTIIGTILNPVSHTYTATGSYIVAHIAYNSCGASVPCSKTVDVVPCLVPVCDFLVEQT